MARDGFLPPDPYESEIRKAEAAAWPEPKAPAPDPKPADPLAAFSSAAEKHKVPVGLILAAEERFGKDQDPAAASQRADLFAAEVARRKAEGARGAALIGDVDDPEGLARRAQEIEAEMFGAPAPAAAPREAQEEGRPGNFLTDMVSGGAGSLGALASAVGADETANYFSKIADENAPPVASYKDVDSFGEGIRYVTGGIAQSIPEMAAVAGVAAATILTGGGALLAGGATLGASTLFNAGRAVDRQRDEGAEDVDYARAYGAGLAMGALDAITPGRLGSAVGSAFKQRMAGAAVTAATRRSIGREALIAAGTEAPTEVMQQLIEIGQANPDLLRVMVNPKPEEMEKSDELLTELVDSAILGGAAGGAFGAAGATAQRLAGRGPEGEAANDAALAPQAPPAPAGPLEAAESVAPAPQMEEPEPESEPAAPLNPRFPDMKPGKEVRIQAPDGLTYDSVFVRETDEGVVVRVGGEEFDISRQEFDAARVAAKRADEEAKQAGKGEAGIPASGRQEASPEQAVDGGDRLEGDRPVASTDQRLEGDDQDGETRPAPAPGFLDNVDPERFDELASYLEYEQGMSREEAEEAARVSLSSPPTNGRGVRPTEEEIADAFGAGPVPDDLAPPAAPQPAPAVEPVAPARPDPQPRPAVPAPHAEADRAPAGPADDAAPAGLKVEDIRAKAAIVRGLPEDAPPAVEGVRFSWDRRDGGWVFSRKHREKVEKALAAPAAAEGVAEAEPAPAGVEAGPDGVRAGERPADLRASRIKASNKTMPAGYRLEDDAEGNLTLMGPDGMVGGKKIGMATPEAFETARNMARAAAARKASEEAKGELPVEDDRERQRRENVAKSEAQKAAAQKDRAAKDSAKEQNALIGEARREWSEGLADAGKRAAAREAGYSEREMDRLRKVLWHNLSPEEQRHLAEAIRALREQGFFGRPAPQEQAAASGPPQPAEAPSSGGAEESPRSESGPAGGDPAYGAGNKLVSADRAAELRARLKAKLKTEIRSGIDPEILAIGAELAVFHIEAGARRFMDLARAVASDLDTTPEKLRPYLRSWYNGARDMMEDGGVSIEGMDDADAVRAALAEIGTSPAPAPSGIVEPAESPTPQEETPDGVQEDTAGGDAGAEPGEVQPASPRGNADGRRDGGGPEGGDAGRADDRGDGQAPERRPARPRPAARDRDRRDGAGDRGGDGGRERPRNYRIPADGLIPKGGPKTRARNSLKAIRTLKTLEAEGRPATPEEQAALALYGGGGTLKAALPGSDGKVSKGFEDIAADLEATTTPEERALIAKTTQYAFYTSEPVLRRMWQAVEQMGFKGGKVYEPGMGVGGFLGTVPSTLAGGMTYTGLELDGITARIAKNLYPESTIRQGDFTREPLARNHYDLVIGNPPFGDIKIQTDPAYPQGFLLHDYFFAKSLDAVRPGGLLAFVTSAGTLNKIDQKARKYLANRAEFVGAIRLPSSAFADFAGTEVTTDVIFLRRRILDEDAADFDRTWTETTSVTLPNAEGVPTEGAVNAWIAAHPEMVLGEPGFFDKLYKGRYAVRPTGNDLDGALRAALDRLPSDVMKDRGAEAAAAEIDADVAERKPGSFYVKDSDLYQFDGMQGAKVEARGKGVKGGMLKADFDRVKALVGIRDSLRSVYAADMAQDAAAAKKARKALNKRYDDFVAEHGAINKATFSFQRPSVIEQERAREEAREAARARGEGFDEGSFDPADLYADGAKTGDVARARRETRERQGESYREGDFDPAEMPDKVIEKRVNVAAFMDDPESYRLRAIERYDDKTGEAEKSAVFFESVVTREPEAKIKSPEDALLHVLNVEGRVNLDRIADLAGSTPETVRDELGTLIFRDPATGRWETREKYLSGNVRQKLRAAQAAADADPSVMRNVEALEAVQPTPVPPADIHVPIGAAWIPASDYAAFADSLGIPTRFSYSAISAAWSVKMERAASAAVTTWGTNDRPFADLMTLLMNGKPVTVRRTEKQADGSTASYVDQEATQAAQDKAKNLREAFGQWIWSDAERAGRLANLYNETFNAEVAPSFDGRYLTTPGIASGWSWRPHQKSVIARILQTGNTYMAHAVGAGKTSAMIGAGMEAKRLGLARKPMYVVPNHMLAQFTKEFYEQYPLAKIAVADERRFHTDRRKLFIADVGANDYDAIILTHSAFGFIPVSDGFSDRFVSQEIDAFEDAIKEAKSEADDRITVSRLENMKEKLEQRLSSKRKEGADQVFTFEEMGVDMLFVDEAHDGFRKLDFATQMGNVKGITPGGTDKAWDLFVKTRYLEERNPGRGLVLASGTPITNTMAELFTVSRYLQSSTLEEKGVDRFDAWANTFGEAVSELEQAPDGGYKTITRFAKFVNTAELSLMVRQVMDVVTSSQLAQYVTRPALKGGGRTLEIVEPTPELKAFQKTLAARMKAIEARKGKPEKGDDIILNVINDGRLAAIDLRLVGGPASDSKLERLIDRAHGIWEATKDQPFHQAGADGYGKKPAARGPAAQMIFTTVGINPTKDSGDFSTVKHIRSSLIARGVPAAEIAFLADAKNHVQRQRLFNDVNEGKVRILIGGEAMFTGVNAQRRLYAVHNLDPLWFPANDEQRNGRIIRQGNMNPEIEIHDYSAKGTYDATMWQMMGRKAGFIQSFFDGDPNLRDMEDLGQVGQYEQAKALSTADPRILTLTEWKQERDTLRRRRGALQREQYSAESGLTSARRALEHRRNVLARWEPLAERQADMKGDAFRAKIGEETFEKRKEFGAALIERVRDLDKEGVRSESAKVGEIAGFDIIADTYPATASFGAREPELAIRFTRDDEVDVGFSSDPVGMARRVEGPVSDIVFTIESIRRDVARYEREVKDREDSIGGVGEFKDEARLKELEGQIRKLETTLAAETAAAAAAMPEDGDGTVERADVGRVPAGWGEIPGDDLPRLTSEQEADLRRRLDAMGLGHVRLTIDPDYRTSTAEGNMNRTLAPAGVAKMRREADGSVAAEIIIAAAVNAEKTLDHEAVHVLRHSGLFTVGEWAALEKQAEGRWIDEFGILDRYPTGEDWLHAEEAIAEAYAAWRAGRVRGANATVRAAFQKILRILRAVAAAVKGSPVEVAAEDVFARIEKGRVARRRAQAQPRKAGGQFAQVRSLMTDESGAVSFEVPKRLSGLRLPRSMKDWIADPGAMTSAALTDAMGGKGGKTNLLALVPGRALFAELGKVMPDAQVYLRLKEQMDAMRNDMHARMDDVAQRWLKMGRADARANNRLMDLMHRATLAGIDPARPFPGSPTPARTAAARKVESDRREAHATLRREFLALPETFQAMFREITAEYAKTAKAQEDAVVAHIQAAQKVAERQAEATYRREMRRIEDEGLKGKERAEAEAKQRRDRIKSQSGWAMKARVGALRQQFESNRLKGPYFPLARFGRYYVTLRDGEGKVVSFSRFESAREQQEFADQKKAEGADVEHGILADKEFDPKSMVDPSFVADVQGLLQGFDTEPGLMDAVWQRWLDTLPDASIRKNRIHRKGRKGYSGDALRAFTNHMFHASHQIARLRYGAEMGYHLDVAAEQAKAAENPERASLALDEMRRRHAFTMNPEGAAWAARATSLAFLWYLSVTPAAAMINVSQTTVVGVPLMKAGFAKASVGSVTRELGRALRDFSRGSGGRDTWSAAKAKTLTADERAAMDEAYQRGAVDKTQAHDLAAVAETGVEYSGLRERWMRRASFLFHHAERLNREVTFLASYRLAKAEGLDQAAAIDKAAAMTWKVHFDYQNTSRPRVMQPDWLKVLTIFRAFTVNMIWRLWRDAHQSLHGATPAERKEARTQLVGITLSMMMHAGVTGVWGYGLVTALLGMFLPGDDDDIDAWLQDALLLEGDGLGAAAWNWTMGAALKGLPGQITQTDLSERLGMPNLWFREPYRDMEGRDLYQHYLGEFLGPMGSIVAAPFSAADYLARGEWWRAGEAMAPKFAKDLSRAVRYSADGVTTLNGDPIVEDVSPYQAIVQALGFTPAQVAERYESNSRMKDRERQIMDERKGLHREAGDAIRAGKSIPEETMESIMDFNRRYPENPITAKTLKASVRGRMRASDRNEYGVALNPKLNQRIRDAEPQMLYN